MIDKLRSFFRSYWPYMLATLVVFAPLLTPGYILTMDMVFVPHPPIPDEVNASYPFYVLLHYVSYILPGDVLQKIVLMTILLLAGVGMHKLLKSLLSRQLARPAIVAASLFYMLGAFVYERLMMGQFAVVAGYALLPFFILTLRHFLDDPTWPRLWRLVAVVVLVSVMSIHTLLPLAMIGAIFVAFEWRRMREFGVKLAAGAGVVIALSAYWLVPTLTGNNTTAAALAGDSSQAFQTQGGLFSVLRLQGFWAENRNLFDMPQQLTPLPGVWQTLVWLAIVAGFVLLWRRQRKLAIMYGSMIVLGCVVALVGLGAAYREPHKIIVLVAIGFSVFGAVGADAWCRYWVKKGGTRRYVGSVTTCSVVLLLCLGMFWGVFGQLKARDYPPEWYALNTQLKSLPGDRAAVFVPWHLYQTYSFSPRIVANPASTFFDHDVIVSNDPEFSGTKALRKDERVDAVDRLLRERSPDIASSLAALDVGYVIVAQEPDVEDYEFLRSTKGLEQIFRQGSLTLYEIKEVH